MTTPQSSSNRWTTDESVQRGSAYDERWARLEAAGASIHGEADFVHAFDPRRVLDAGCGTGRVAIELARRGVEVVGLDADPAMLDAARTKAPHLDWREGDLARLHTTGALGDVAGQFDVVVAAGNVMIFVEPGTEALVVANMATQLAPGGRLVTGFSLRPGGYDRSRLIDDADAAGLTVEDRWSTWGRSPFEVDRSDYIVAVMRRSEET